MSEPPSQPPLPSEPAAEEAAVAWGPLEAVAGLIAVLLALVFGGTIVVAFAGEKGLDAVLGQQVLLAASLVGVALAVAAGVGGEGARAAARALGLRRPRRGWIKALGIAIAAYLVSVIVLVQIAGEPTQTDIADRLGVNDGLVTAIAAGVLIVLVAPFCEELFFRGFFFGGLRRRMPFWAAALGSGLLFGLIHLSDANVIAGAILAIFGVVLAWLYEETRSIWPPIALHAANNVAAFVELVTS